MRESHFEDGKWWVSPYNFVPEVRNQLLLPPKVQIHDATLRDGEQTPGVVFSIDDKIAISRKLDEIGVDRIEAGMPAVSAQDATAITEITKLGLKARIFTFARALKQDIDMALEEKPRCARCDHRSPDRISQIDHTIWLDLERCVREKPRRYQLCPQQRPLCGLFSLRYYAREGPIRPGYPRSRKSTTREPGICLRTELPAVGEYGEVPPPLVGGDRAPGAFATPLGIFLRLRRRRVRRSSR